MRQAVEMIEDWCGNLLTGKAIRHCSPDFDGRYGLVIIDVAVGDGIIAAYLQTPGERRTMRTRRPDRPKGGFPERQGAVLQGLLGADTWGIAPLWQRPGALLFL